MLTFGIVSYMMLCLTDQGPVGPCHSSPMDTIIEL